MHRSLAAALAAAYRLTTRAPAPEDTIEVEPGLSVPRFVYDWSLVGPEEARLFLDRMPTSIRLQGRTVLAVGRGAADLASVAVESSPSQVIALDMAVRRMRLTQRRLREEPPTAPLEIASFADGLERLEDRTFDVVLAADAFRSYGAPRSGRDLERLVAELAARLGPAGTLAIGFGPPWKAPFGGQIDSRLPWAHLLFPEDVVFEEFRRARTANEARTFADIGVNRITVARFRHAMEMTGLECLALVTNLGESRAMRAMRALSRLPWLEEYFSQNVYGVWRRP